MVNYITAVGVQQFSVTIGAGSLTGTASVIAPGSGGFLLYGGVNPVSSAAVPATGFARLSISGGTITGTRAGGTSPPAGAIVVKGCLIDGDTTNLIASIQYGTVTIAGGSATGTASISAVTNANALVHFLGETDANASYNGSNDRARLSLSGTTVTATRVLTTGALTVGFVVIEFQGAALNQAVQNVSASNGTSNVASWTASLTSVNTSNTIMLYGGSTITNSNANLAIGLPKAVLTNGTTVTISTNTSTSNTRIVNLAVVEFAVGVLNSAVQRNTTTLTGVTSNTSAITSVTAANSGISYLGNTFSTTTAAIDQAEGAVTLTDGSTVTVTKGTATNNITASWEVFEFPPFGGGVTQKLNSIWFGAIA